MFGHPEGTEEGLLADLRIAAGAGVGHLSLYGLTIEPETVRFCEIEPSS